MKILQGLEKVIPGAPENEVPVHLRKRQIFARSIKDQIDWPERPVADAVAQKQMKDANPQGGAAGKLEQGA